MQGLTPLRGRTDTSPGVFFSVALPLWFLLFLVQPLPVGTDLLEQGNCIRSCATPRAGGAPGSCPDLSFPLIHKNRKDLTASSSRSVQTFLRAWQATIGVPGEEPVGPFRCPFPSFPRVLYPGDLGLEGADQPGNRRVHVSGSAHPLCVFAHTAASVSMCVRACTCPLVLSQPGSSPGRACVGDR